MVLDSVLYHPVLTRLIHFLESVPGREKILRLLQYLNRVLYNSSGNPLNKQLQMQFALCRKILRFLKPLNNLQAVSRAVDSSFAKNLHIVNSTSTMQSVMNVVKISKIVFYGGYLFLDQFTLLSMLKVCKLSPARSQKVVKYTNMCWFYGLVSSLLISAYDLKSCAKQSGQQEPQSRWPSGVSQWKLVAPYKKIIWDCLDMYVVLNNLKKLHSDDSNVALAGLTTSIFGVQEVWSSMK